MMKFLKPGGLVEMDWSDEQLFDHYRRGVIDLVDLPDFYKGLREFMKHPNPLFLHPGYTVSDFLKPTVSEDELIVYDDGNAEMAVQPFMVDHFLRMATNHMVLVGIENHILHRASFMMVVAPEDLIFKYERYNIIDSILSSL